MGNGAVRTHTRRTASGKTTTVRRHGRRGRGRRGLVSPGHAWQNARKAVRAMRRRKRLTAAVLGGLAVGELGAWATLRGVGLALAVAGGLALAVAYLAGMASGADL